MNCVECFSLRLLLEQILNKLNHLSSSEGGCSTQITCETFNDFVRLFKQVTKAESLKDQTVYIVSNLISFYHLFGNCLLGQFLYICFKSGYVYCTIQRCFWDTKYVLDVFLIQRELRLNGRVLTCTTCGCVRRVRSDNHEMQNTNLGMCGTASWGDNIWDRLKRMIKGL